MVKFLTGSFRVEPRVPVCPFFPAAGAFFAISKAIALSTSLPLLKALLSAVDIFLGDLSFIGIFFVGLFLEGSKFPFILRLLVNILFSLLIFWYGLDAILIMKLNYRANVLDLFSFASEIEVLEEIRKAGYFLILYLALIIYVQRFKIRVLRTHIATWAIVLLLLSTLGLSSRSRYATNMALVRSNFIGTFTSKFTPEELTKLDAEVSLFLPKEAPAHSVVLLVIIESMSATDSLRTSGISDNFPKFDEISKRGKLFTNFIANYTMTEGGLVSLFMGNAPMVFPGYPLSFRAAFWEQDSIVRALAKHGYHSVFLSSAPLAFREKGKLAKKFGFDDVQGLEEIPRLCNSPRFTFNAAADHVLYEEALERLEREQRDHKNLFLVVETTSSHLPYIDPLGRENTERNVLSYVDNEFEWFYSQIDSRKFFDRGVLLVTGDHHKPIPITGAERRKYGPSAEARIPLMVIGKGISSAVDDRLFQQADLFRYLPAISDLKKKLTDPAIFVEAYTAPVIGSNPTSVRVFTENGGYYSLNFMGKDFSWNGDALPANQKAIELDVVRRLARLQFCYDRSPQCSTGKPQHWFFPGM